MEEFSPSEVQVVAKQLIRDNGYEPMSDEHLLAILEFFDLKRLTKHVESTLSEVLNRQIDYVD